MMIPRINNLTQFVFRLTVLAVFLSPMIALRVYSALSFSDALLALGLLLLLFSMANHKAKIPLPSSDIYWMPWFFFSLLLITGLAISSVVSVSPASRALSVGGQYLFALVLVPLLLWTVAMKHSRGPALLVRWFVRGMVLVCVVAVCIQLYKPMALQHMVTSHGRVSSLLENPNQLAKLIAISFPMMLYAYVRKIIGKYEVIAYAPLFLIALMSTGSIGGFFTMLVTIIVALVLFAGVDALKFLLLSSCLAILSVLILGVPGIFQKRVTSGFAGDFDITDQGSGRLKLGLAHEALELIQPFIGVGVDEYRRYSALGGKVHNTILLTWVEGGFLALIGMLGIFILPLAIGFRHLRSRYRFEAALVISTAVALGFSSLTNTHIYGRYWTVPLIISLVVLVTRLQNTRLGSITTSSAESVDKSDRMTGRGVPG